VLVREPLVPRLAQQLRHLTMLLGRFRHGPIVSSVDPPGRRPNPGGSFPDRQWGGGGESADQKILFRGRRLKGPNRSTFVTIAQSNRSRKWRLLIIKINSCRS
jgi:hypothetical protein